MVEIYSGQLEGLLSSPSQFGDSQQLRLVRILRSTVMVRVGGGWMALDEFLVKNDPCRGKETLTVRVVTLCKYVHLVLFSSIKNVLGVQLKLSQHC